MSPTHRHRNGQALGYRRIVQICLIEIINATWGTAVHKYVYTLTVYTRMIHTLTVCTLSVYTLMFYTLPIYTSTVYTLSVYTLMFYTLPIYTPTAYTLMVHTLTVCNVECLYFDVLYTADLYADGLCADIHTLTVCTLMAYGLFV